MGSSSSCASSAAASRCISPIAPRRRCCRRSLTRYERAKELSTLSEKVANKQPYVEPANGELTQAQVDRFIKVQDQVQLTLGPRWQDMKAKADAMQQKADAGNRDMSFTEAMSVLSDLSTILIDARRAQVDALNAHQFSNEEYNWVRVRAYEAAGLELAGSIDLSALEKAINEGGGQSGVQMPRMSLPEAPEANRAMMKPHVEKLKEWWGLAFLGL